MVDAAEADASVKAETMTEDETSVSDSIHQKYHKEVICLCLLQEEAR